MLTIAEKQELELLVSRATGTVCYLNTDGKIRLKTLLEKEKLNDNEQ